MLKYDIFFGRSTLFASLKHCLKLVIQFVNKTLTCAVQKVSFGYVYKFIETYL
jgi:hypothetical protein